MPRTVVAGDTLSKIAAELGVSLPDLLAANPGITNPNMIHPGDEINVPGEEPGATDPAAVPATTGESTTGLDTTAELTPEAEAALLDIYPNAAYYLQNPELRPIIEQAGEEGWSDSRLQQAITQTNWWQTTSASARVFDDAQQNDPAGVQRQLATTRLDIQRQAQRAGIALTSARLDEITFDATRLGWSELEVNEALGVAAMNSGFSGVGSIATDRDTVLSLARRYHIPMTDEDAAMWATRLFNGSTEMASIDTWIRNQAKAMFPELAEQFDLGLTTEDYMRPLVNVAAQELDMNPNAIDLTNTKYSALYGLSSYTDVRQWARQQDEWQYTKKATDRGYEITNALLSTFGAI
jgi:LysM repeat protein